MSVLNGETMLMFYETHSDHCPRLFDYNRFRPHSSFNNMTPNEVHEEHQKSLISLILTGTQKGGSLKECQSKLTNGRFLGKCRILLYLISKEGNIFRKGYTLVLELNNSKLLIRISINI